MSDRIKNRIINHRSIKKIFLIIFIFFLIFSSCFSATRSSPTATPRKKIINHHQKHSVIASPQKQIKKNVLNRNKKKLTPLNNIKRKKTLHKNRPKKNTRPQRNRQQIRHSAIKKLTNRTLNRPNTGNITKTQLPGYLLTAIEKTLVEAVRKTITTLRYTTYKLGGTHIDPARGIFVVDCSTYVDHVLKTVYPHAYTNLTNWSGSLKPTSNDYYHYFMNLPQNNALWNTIDDVELLRPGDILVFRYKNRWGSERGGHVMIVMDKPIRQANTFQVRVADSAPTGHSTDTRMSKASGIGIGTLLLKIDPKTYQPYAYAWKVGSRWEKNVNFAMARPINLG